MNLIGEGLFHLSNALLVPVELLLVALLGWTLFALGEFAQEWLHRRRSSGWLTRSLACIDGLPPVGAPLPRWVAGLGRLLAARDTTGLQIERYLDDAEADLTRAVEIASLISKLGPMLGLAGTLIPLGPALAAMSAGDTSRLASQLTVAFTATVVGLAIAGVCFWISLTRRRWYSAQVREMEYLYRSHAARGAQAIQP